jgi:hypothetical protein
MLAITSYFEIETKAIALDGKCQRSKNNSGYKKRETPDEATV